MTTARITYKNLWRDGEVIYESSEHPQYPSENSQDDVTVLPWRSRHGTDSGNGLFVVTAGVNAKIDFDEGGAELTATITAGSYNGQTLATEVATQLTAAGGTYTCTYDESTGMFTIARAAGNFTIRWQSGTNTLINAAGLLGYSKVANDTGAATYTSDTIVCHTAEYIDVDLGSAILYNHIGIINHNLTSAATITLYGADDSAFTSNVVTDVLTWTETNLWEYLGTARTKRYVRLRVNDVANSNCYVQFGTVVLGSYFTPNRNFGPYSDGQMDDSETELSPSGNMFLVQERQPLTNKSLPFKGLDESSIGYVKALLLECGKRKAFAVCTDTTAASTNTIWAHLQETTPPEYQHYDYWNWEAALEEVM